MKELTQKEIIEKYKNKLNEERKNQKKILTDILKNETLLRTL